MFGNKSFTYIADSIVGYNLGLLLSPLWDLSDNFGGRFQTEVAREVSKFLKGINTPTARCFADSLHLVIGDPRLQQGPLSPDVMEKRFRPIADRLFVPEHFKIEISMTGNALAVEIQLLFQNFRIRIFRGLHTTEKR